MVELLDLGLEVPDLPTISPRQAGLDIHLPVRSSNEPVYVVVASTGLKVCGEGEWKVGQHGYSKRRTWRKLHLAVDGATGQILVTVAHTWSNRCPDVFEPTSQDDIPKGAHKHLPKLPLFP